MRCICSVSPDHVLSENRCITTLNEIRTNLMNDSTPVHQAYAMARIHFSAKTIHNIAAAKNSHIRTNLHQIGAVRKEAITVEPGINQNQLETNVGSSVNDLRYMNIANDLYDSDMKQMVPTQICNAFVADAKN